MLMIYTHTHTYILLFVSLSSYPFYSFVALSSRRFSQLYLPDFLLYFCFCYFERISKCPFIFWPCSFSPPSSENIACSFSSLFFMHGLCCPKLLSSLSLF